jgi:hypothetical protein
MANSNIQLEEYIHEFRQEYGTCLDWIFKELKNPKNLGYRQELMELFKPYGISVMSSSAKPPILHVIFWFWNGPKFFNKDSRQVKQLEDRMRPKKLGLEHLQFGAYDPIEFLLNFKNVMYYKGFMICYFWLERLYYVSAGRNLHFEDALNIYFGGVIEKLIIGLDKFEELNTIPEPDCELFRKLGKVRVNKDAEKFKDRTGRILTTGMKIHGFKDYILFKESENPFLDCLAAFSAVNSGRENITIDDYITAYKTYYKLLKTDLTQYKCQKELFNDKYHGYLVCQDCGSFYELKRGEKPDDFTNCHCQGNLKYVKYLKDDTKIKWKSILINILLFTTILLISFKIMELIYFMIIGVLLLFLTTGPTSIIDEQDKYGLVLGSSIIIILSFLLSSTIIQLYFKNPGNYLVLFIPMCLILALDLVIILKRRPNINN